MDLGGIVAVVGALISGALAGFVAGGITGYLGGLKFAVELDSLKARTDRLWANVYTQKGVDARSDQAAEMEEMLTEAAMIVKQNEGGDGKKIAGELLGVMTKHPKIAGKLIKKMGVTL